MAALPRLAASQWISTRRPPGGRAPTRSARRRRRRGQASTRVGPTGPSRRSPAHRGRPRSCSPQKPSRAPISPPSLTPTLPPGEARPGWRTGIHDPPPQFAVDGPLDELADRRRPWPEPGPRASTVPSSSRLLLTAATRSSTSSRRALVNASRRPTGSSHPADRSTTAQSRPGSIRRRRCGRQTDGAWPRTHPPPPLAPRSCVTAAAASPARAGGDQPQRSRILGGRPQRPVLAVPAPVVDGGAEGTSTDRASIDQVR